jgi:hypothetical protein
VQSEPTVVCGRRIDRTQSEATVVCGRRVDRTQREPGGKWGGRLAPPIQ